MAFTVLFWNVRGVHKPSWAGRAPRLRGGISRLAASRQIDILILAEYAFADAELLRSLNAAGVGRYHAVEGSDPRLRLFSRLTDARWADRFSSQVDDRMTAHILRVGNSRPLLLVGLHGRDRTTSARSKRMSATDARSSWATST